MLDTSALVNAIRSSTGAATEIIRMVLNGNLVLLLDYKLSCEYREVALRPEHVHASGSSRDEVEAFIGRLEFVATQVLIHFKHRPLSKDANDDLVLDVAINGSADVIVTSNRKHFEVAARGFGIQASSPREFLQDFLGGRYKDATKQG